MKIKVQVPSKLKGWIWKGKNLDDKESSKSKKKTSNMVASTTTTTASAANSDRPQEDPATILICGGGIVGLTLALAIKKELGITCEIHEQAPEFHDYVGAGMGMYPNGLRVIRDISPDLLSAIRSEGYPYMYRTFARHDGHAVVTAEENARQKDEDEELHAMGICRWRLQKTLYQAIVDQKIPIYFGKKLRDLQTKRQRKDGLTELTFEDGTKRLTKFLFAADGSRSMTRQIVTSAEGRQPSQLVYSGVSCIMGIANLAPEQRGIAFPSASTTKCHACFFPTGPDEQCFQIHFPLPPDHAKRTTWGQLREEVCRDECGKLAEQLEKDNWHEKYYGPLKNVKKAVQIGFCSLKPALESLVFDESVVLLGDAAHPPVPYTGQGAQMGLEDAGTIALLLKHFCSSDGKNQLNMNNFELAMKLYEKLRIPRTSLICRKSLEMGDMQQKRATCQNYNRTKEQLLQREVFFHENLQVYDLGTKFDYRKAVMDALQQDENVCNK